LVNFLLMCITVVTLPKYNPDLFKEIRVVSSRKVQLALSWAGIFILSGFLCIHIWKDLSSDVQEWYFHSTPVWLIVMTIATFIYARERARLNRTGINVHEFFKKLPPE